MILTVLFYIAFVISVSSTGMVVTSRNPVHAAIYLILSLFGVSIVFYCLGAPFLAFLEIIIYAGAIMVLFMFVVMLLNVASAPPVEPPGHPRRKLVILPIVFALILLCEIVACFFVSPPMSGRGVILTGPEIGLALYNKHYLGVELASLILLIGIVGGMHLGRAASISQTREKSIHVTSE